MGLLLDAAYLTAAVVTAPLWLRKKRGGWSERFAKIDPLSRASKPRLLLHAVSVGEVNALRPLVPLLEKQYDLVISATTDTGTKRAKDLFADRLHIVRYPLDFTPTVNRFLNAVKPDAVVLVELELWPNFAKACAMRNIPLGIVNGRLSSRSYKRYRLLRLFFGRTFRRLAFCAVQDDVYAARFERVGVPKNKINITGQMKWDIASVDVDQSAVDALATKLGIDRTRPLIVAGSTAPGEHQLLHESVAPDVQLLCAPRRPEWFNHAADELGRCFRYTSTQRPILAGDTINRYLLDTIGQLSNAYALADIVVIGRSFEPYHGSDPMEPASLGKPVLIGPHHEDFAVTVKTMVDAGAVRIVESADLKSTLRDLLNNSTQRTKMGNAAKSCVQSHQGASTRNANIISECLVNAAEQTSASPLSASAPSTPAEPQAQAKPHEPAPVVLESQLLANIYKRSSDLPDHITVGPGDDSAVLNFVRKNLLITTDQLVESVHFHPDATVEHIANHALGRALSDIAAMGGSPCASTATATIRKGWPHTEQLFDAMHTLALEWDCPLVGGDIASHDGPTVLSVTMLGNRHKTRAPVLRSGAKVGDGVYVTGTLGNAQASNWTSPITPRTDTAAFLCDTLAKNLHAMIDISDGLGIDAARIAHASEVKIELDAGAIPCAEGIDWQAALQAGGDYELCFTASGDVPDTCDTTGIPITLIGTVEKGTGVIVRTPDGQTIDASTLGWDHAI